MCSAQLFPPVGRIPRGPGIRVFIRRSEYVSGVWEYLGRLKHLFFDLGGTLIDLRGLAASMALEVGERYPPLRSKASQIAGRWFQMTADAVAAGQDKVFRPQLHIARIALARAFAEERYKLRKSSATYMVRAAWRSYLKQAKVFDDVSPGLLLSLRSHVQNLGIITDSDEDAVASLLSQLKLESIFDVVVVSESIGAYKPDPRIYLAALERVGGEATSTGFVSESLLDLHGALAVGMGAIWVCREIPPRGLLAPQGTVIINDLRKLLEIVS